MVPTDRSPIYVHPSTHARRLCSVEMRVYGHVASLCSARVYAHVCWFNASVFPQMFVSHVPMCASVHVLIHVHVTLPVLRQTASLHHLARPRASLKPLPLPLLLILFRNPVGIVTDPLATPPPGAHTMTQQSLFERSIIISRP